MSELMNDTISRQQAITALRALSDEDGYINVPHEVVTDVVRGLPPVRSEHEQTTQPEQTKKDKFGVKISETCEDCISRQAAIDAVESMLRRKFGIGGDLAEITLAGLPSAQPDAPDTNVGTMISRQAACEYCHEDSDGYVMPLEKNSHAFIRFGMDGWEIDLNARGWHGSAKIRFCPMCGRELGHG